MKNIMYIKYNFQQFILIFINKKFVFKYPIKKSDFSRQKNTDNIQEKKNIYKSQSYDYLAYSKSFLKLSRTSIYLFISFSSSVY